MVLDRLRSRSKDFTKTASQSSPLDQTDYSSPKSRSASSNQHDSACLTCNSPATHKCPRCEGVSYCSANCQRADWMVHKFLCAPNSKRLLPPRKRMVRALLFPEDEATVKVLWLPYITNDDGEVLKRSSVKNYIYFPEVNGVRRNCVISRTPLLDAKIRGRPHDHALLLMYRDSFMFDGSLPNRSIDAVTQGKMKRPWRGPVLLVAEASLDSDGPLTVEDVTMNDFRDAIDFFLRHNG